VVAELLARGYRVVALDNLSGGFRSNVEDRATFVCGSILDVELIDRLFVEHRFDYVFHLAAYAAEGLSHFIRRFNYQNNLMGSVNLINASVRNEVRCFVFTSSMAVYGGATPPVTEDMPTSPEDPYGIAKAAVELDLRAAREMFGMPYIIIRPHNVYGERQNIGDRYRNVVGIFMNKLLRGEPVSIFGDGTQTRAFSYISDVAPIIAQTIERPEAYNQIFNIGADHPVSINELAETVCRVMNIPFAPRYMPTRFEVKHIYPSHAKARRVLGYHGRVALEDGLRAMATWVKRVGARATRRFDGIEIERNLPPSWRD